MKIKIGIQSNLQEDFISLNLANANRPTRSQGRKNPS